MSECDIRDQTLLEVLRRVRSLSGNEKYEQAWRVVDRVLTKMLADGTTSVPDKREQIGS